MIGKMPRFPAHGERLPWRSMRRLLRRENKSSQPRPVGAATPSRCSHAQSVQPRPVGAATPSREMPARKMTSPPAVSPLREGIPAVAHWSQVSVTDDFQTYSQQQSRKDKSLGLLSLRFLRNLPSPSDAATGRQIYVDNMASVLGVERRRIYDVVNVLESLALLSRVAKNRYCWHGPEAMKQALKQLGAPEEESNPSSCSSSDSSEEPHPMHAETGSRLSNRFPHILRGGRKEKSLRTLSQRFVMLFLTSSTKDIDLDTAASSIINHYSPCGPEDEKQFKTTVRRLYDIANILSSLGLLRKTHTVSGGLRRPTFEWVGPSGLTDAHVPHDTSPMEKESTAAQTTQKSKKKNDKKTHPSQPAGASAEPGLVPAVWKVEQGQCTGAHGTESPVPGETTPTCQSSDLIDCESKDNCMFNTRVEDCDGGLTKKQFLKMLRLCPNATTNSEEQPESKRRCIFLPPDAPPSTKVLEKEGSRAPNTAENQKAIVQNVPRRESAHINDASCTTYHGNVTRPVIWVPFMFGGEAPGHDVQRAYSRCATLPRVQQGPCQGRTCPETCHGSTSDTCTSSTGHHYQPPMPSELLDSCSCLTDSAPGSHGVLRPCGTAGLCMSPQWVPTASALWLLTPQLAHVIPSLPKRPTADRMH